MAEGKRIINAIVTNPSIAIRLRGDLRRLSFNHFPYTVTYRRLGDHVRVLAVAIGAGARVIWRAAHDCTTELLAQPNPANHSNFYIGAVLKLCTVLFALLKTDTVLVM